MNTKQHTLQEHGRQMHGTQVTLVTSMLWTIICILKLTNILYKMLLNQYRLIQKRN